MSNVQYLKVWERASQSRRRTDHETGKSSSQIRTAEIETETQKNKLLRVGGVVFNAPYEQHACLDHHQL
jgi:hypothetical protein